MLNYIEYLNIPAKMAFILVAVFLVIQIIGELLEFKGKVVPEYIKIRKYFKRRKDEREIIANVPVVLERVESLLAEVGQHYNDDNITKRNDWMQWVNNKAVVYDSCLSELEKKLDKNNAITLSLLIENKRSEIINFARYVIDENAPVTREQFNRVFKTYDEYEKIIEENGLTNGEVDISIHIIKESYENHMKNHTFVEDIRGYNAII